MKFRVIDENKEVLKSNLTFDEAHDFVVEHEKNTLVIELDMDGSSGSSEQSDTSSSSSNDHDGSTDNAIMAGIR